MFSENDKIGRLYINITNKCNLDCEFCCMYSNPQKTTFMSFNTYKNIIDEAIKKNDFNYEIQLEGGEPTLHPSLALFMLYAFSTRRVTKIIIMTNGLKVVKERDLLLRIIDTKNVYKSQIYQPKIEFKISINKSVLDKLDIKELSYFDFSIKYVENVSIFLNARYDTEEEKEFIEKQINEFTDLGDRMQIFQLQSYGKFSDRDDLSKPIIVQNVDEWFIYASDGKCFNQDLIARSEYEKELK